MAGDFDIQLNTAYHSEKWLSGSGLGPAMRVDAASLLAAAQRAVQPGLVALQSNVNQIRARTGALKQSPGIKAKLYGNGGRRTATALVGFKSGVAPHAYYVEFGTKPRRRRGSMVGLKPLTRAFQASRPAIESAMTRELQSLMAKAAGSVR
jgi:hypothetical protein